MTGPVQEASAPLSSAAPANAATIAVRSLCKSFRRAKQGHGVEVLRDISFDVAEGSFVSLVGPSGCGKTTLLRMLNGLISPDSGTILVNDMPPKPGPHMGFVFQNARLMPWRTIRENVIFPLEVNHISRSECDDRAQELLSLVGLSKFAQAYPHELSGGMRQRAALVQALISRPRFLLMDEPFANLDAQTREFMQFELMRIWSDHKAVVIFVTHSVDEAILLSDRIILLRPRPGRVEEVIEVGFPHPRWTYDIRSEERFATLRTYLWNRVKDMVLDDPNSEFYGRGDRLGVNIRAAED